MDDGKSRSKNEMVLDSLIWTTRMFSKHIRIQFCIKKCITMMNKGRKMKIDDDIEMHEENLI